MARNSPVGIFESYAPNNSMKHVGSGVMGGHMYSGHRQRRLDFESIIPEGVTAQTANGTSHDIGTGYNRTEPYSGPQVSPGGPWPAGRSNRSGE